MLGKMQDWPLQVWRLLDHAALMTAAQLVGVAVFKRCSWGVQLTDAGERFLPRAKRALRHVQEGAGEHTLNGIRAWGRGEEGGLTVNKGSRFAR